MAVNKIPESASFSIEVRKGTDALGNPTYSKKSFSSVREDAEPEKVLAVAEAIKDVIKNETRNTLDLCQYSRHFFLVFLSRFCNKIFIILWSHITNSAMNSFSVIPTLNIFKY